jgi:hypothetical protein
MIDTNRGNQRICIGTLSVALLMNREGQVSTKMEEWAQTPEAARMLLQVLISIVAPALQQKIDTASPIIITPAEGV